MKQIVTLLLALVLVAQSAESWAQSGAQESTLGQIGSGAGSVLGSAVYTPFKASFCILGGIGSGFAFLVAGPQTANKVVSTSCRGTWAITPNVIRGEEPVRFIGDTPAPARKSAGG